MVARRRSTESGIYLLRHAHARRGTSENDGKVVENVTLFFSFNFVSLVIVMLLKA